jgi:hypothetical protein
MPWEGIFIKQKITFLPVFVVLPGALEIVNQRAKKEDNTTSKRQPAQFSLSAERQHSILNARPRYTHCIIYITWCNKKSHFSLLILLQNAPEKNAGNFFSQN